jgi:hypothetical protein
MSSHRLHLLIGFDVQTDNPLPLGFENQTKKPSVILWAKSSNRSCRF